MSKYDPLTNYLKHSKDHLVRLSFDDIEDIMGCPLSESARTYRAMWANSSSHLSRFWTSVGWMVNRVNYSGEPYVEFIKRLNDEDDIPPPTVATVKPLEVPELIKNLYELYQLGIIDGSIYTEKKKVLLEKIR